MENLLTEKKYYLLAKECIVILFYLTNESLCIEDYPYRTNLPTVNTYYVHTNNVTSGVAKFNS